MYTDLFLSFPDEATAKAVLYRIEGASEATEESPAVEGYEVPNFQNIDTIGLIYKPTGEMLHGEDGEYPAMAPIPGWHVNVRALSDEDTAPLLPYAVTPTTPRRRFGGTIELPVTPVEPGEPWPVGVPKTVTMRQARLALLGAGLLAQVDAAIASLPEPMKSAANIEWQYSNEVHRHNGVVSQLAPALGLTEEQIDQLFVAAAAL